MALRESINQQGGWLFKWRSYLPFIGIPILLIALRESDFLDRIFGSGVDMIWGFFCFGVSLLGQTVRCLVAGYVPRGTSGRNTQSQVADTLNVTGMYSIVRNPLYLGNFFMVLGAVLCVQVWWLIALVVFGFWFYHERIIFTEEEFLREKFKDAFLSWARKTPIFIPNFKFWTAPRLPFSYKTMLRREFSTFFSLIASFTFLNIVKDSFYEKQFKVHPVWAGIFAAGLIFYITMVYLKKKTKVLNVEGR